MTEQAKAGWEVEGFIDRLTRRDDTNSERLVLEAISHLRAFSQDCDELRDKLDRLRALQDQLVVVLKHVADMTHIGTDLEWHFKRGYDPQRVLDAIAAADSQQGAR